MSAELPFLKKSFADLVGDLLADLGSGSGGRAALTDTTEGSVVRTLVEAFARELAVSYEQLERVYRYGYLDTADGVALDNVVALLGVRRRRAGRVEGAVTFSRILPAGQDIPIPRGTLVAGRDAPLFETAEQAVLVQGDTSVAVAVRSVDEEQEIVPSGSLAVMHRPIWGIETVANPADLLPSQREETDEELRERARVAVQRANLGTVGALEQAVASLGFSDVRVQERIPEMPGQVEVIVGDLDLSGDDLDRIRDAVEAARPAGIKATVRGVTRIWVNITATLELARDFSQRERRAIEAEIRGGLDSYLSSLKVNENVHWARVQDILLGHEAVLQIERTGQKPYLEPLVEENGELGSPAMDPTLRRDNSLIGIFIGARERAQQGQVSLTLEPPTLDVWIDVDVEVSGNQEAQEAERNISEALARSLTVGVSLSFESLSAAIRSAVPGSQPVRFTVIHDRDGRVVELVDEDDEADLADREKPRVRRINVRVVPQEAPND